MKVPASFQYCGRLSGVMPAARAELARREAPAGAARWDLLPWLLALVLALHCAEARPAADLPAAPVAAIAHL